MQATAPAHFPRHLADAFGLGDHVPCADILAISNRNASRIVQSGEPISFPVGASKKPFF